MTSRFQDGSHDVRPRVLLHNTAVFAGCSLARQARVMSLACCMRYSSWCIVHCTCSKSCCLLYTSSRNYYLNWLLFNTGKLFNFTAFFTLLGRKMIQPIVLHPLHVPKPVTSQLQHFVVSLIFWAERRWNRVIVRWQIIIKLRWNQYSGNVTNSAVLPTL